MYRCLSQCRQIYAAQLDDLPPDARDVARRASVAGRRFQVGALPSLGTTDKGLEPLRRRELVTGPINETLLGDGFAYRHALLRDAGYASLARADRARLHVRLARWIEQAAGDRSAEVAEQIATHYAAALESVPALARYVDEGLDRAQTQRLAADWYERAGEAALSLAAHDAARQLLRSCIDLTPEQDFIGLARRWERLADATAFAADMTEGATAYQQAIDYYRLALADGRPPVALEGLARATASLTSVWYQQLRFDELRDLADKTLNELPDADPGSQSRLVVARARGAIGAGGSTPQVRKRYRAWRCLGKPDRRCPAHPRRATDTDVGHVRDGRCEAAMHGSTSRIARPSWATHTGQCQRSSTRPFIPSMTSRATRARQCARLANWPSHAA